MNKIFNWPPWLKFLILIGVGVLIIVLIKGCKNNKEQAADIKALVRISDSLKALTKDAVIGWRQSEAQYRDSLEFERGQRLLAEAQKERIEDDLMRVNKDNAALLEKYKYYKYADTNMVLAPKEFVDDCKDCFTKLETTDRLSITYRKQVNDWSKKYERETSLLQNRISKVESERDVFHHKVDSFATVQKTAVNKIKQRGRLYLSWGVLYQPWPKYAGAGFMYQTKNNMIYGAKWYYGTGGQVVETTINFPLSLRKLK